MGLVYNSPVPSSCCWYAVYTRSRFEKKALGVLMGKGIECYLPLKKEIKRWGRHSRVVQTPLISCYLFVRIDHTRYYDVLVVAGINNYVCFDGKPAVIPDEQIEALKALMEARNNDVEVTSERLHKGDIVRVATGLLAGVCGEVHELGGIRRLVLRFDALGCCIHVDLGQNKIDLLRSTLAAPSSQMQKDIKAVYGH